MAPAMALLAARQQRFTRNQKRAIAVRGVRRWIGLSLGRSLRPGDTTSRMYAVARRQGKPWQPFFETNAKRAHAGRAAVARAPPPPLLLLLGAARAKAPSCCCARRQSIHTHCASLPIPPTYCRSQLALLAGGAAGARALRTVVRTARAEQRGLIADVAAARQQKAGSGGGGGGAGGRGGSRKVAVDGLFLRRLLTILRM